MYDGPTNIFRKKNPEIVIYRQQYSLKSFFGKIYICLIENSEHSSIRW